MKKIRCWLLSGLLLSPTLTANADNNPRIITVDGGFQAGTNYDDDFGNDGFFTSTCENPTQVQGIQAWGGISYIRLGDFNGNGRLDIASPHGPWVLVKTTDPEFFNDFTNCLRHLSPAPVTNEWGGANYTWVGDFNGDRRDDIASASGQLVYMKISTGSGFASQRWGLNFPLVMTVPNPLWGGSDYTWVADFNGDNKDDIASAVGGSVRVHLSTGSGSSGFASQVWGVTNEWASGAWTRIGDFNGDGKDDIASANGASVYMKLSSGSGFISQTWSVANTWGAASYTWVADFNRDGRSDIASANGAAGVVHMKLSQGTHFSSVDWPVTINNWGGAQYTWMMDYDSDGYKDIVTAYNPSTLVTQRNNSGTGFSSASYNYFGWWGPGQNTWALDHSRFSFLGP